MSRATALAATGERLLDTTGMAEWLVDHGATLDRVDQTHGAAVTYVRDKPGESLLVGYRFGEHLAHALWWCDPARAATAWAKAQTLRVAESALGLGAARLDDHTIAWGFPNDAVLRRLRWFVEPRKLKRSLSALAPPGDRVRSESRSQVLSYKPRRRAVLRVHLEHVDDRAQDLVLRYSTEPCGHRMLSAARSLLDAGVLTPEPVAVLEAGQVSVTAFLPGSSLADPDALLRVDAGTLAATLVRVHSQRVDGLGTLDAGSALVTLGRRMAGFESHPDVELAKMAVAIESALTAGLPDGLGSGLVHGDLSLDNLVLTPSGSVGLIDLERSSAAPAEADLGRLLAVSEAEVSTGRLAIYATEVAATTVDEYRNIAAVDGSGLAWFHAAELAGQAVQLARYAPADQRVRELLARALEVAPGRASTGTRVEPDRVALEELPEWFQGWDTAWPHVSRPWTIASRGRVARCDPELGRCQVVVDDAELPGLEQAVNEGASLVSWRIGRRAILRRPDGSWVKVARPKRIQAMARAWSAAQGTGALVPELLEVADDSITIANIGGRSLHGLMRKSVRSPGGPLLAPVTIDAVARTLVDLHRGIENCPRELIDGLVEWQPDSPERWCATVARASPGFAARLAVEAAGLPTVGELSATATIHTDLHDKNLIVTDTGAVAAIDLDDLRLGPAEADLANLSAHLVLRQLQSGGATELGIRAGDALIDAYRDRSTAGVDSDLVDALARHTYFRLAGLYFFRTKSRHLVPTLLSMATH